MKQMSRIKFAIVATVAASSLLAAEDGVDITVFSTGNGHKKCGWANLSN